MIDHAVEYVNSNVHTNGMENFWRLLKRGLKGTYVSVDQFNLFRYLDEQAMPSISASRRTRNASLMCARRSRVVG